MFACMVEIHDLNRAGEMPVGKIPDPVRAIAHDDSDSGPVPASVVGLRIDPEPEVARQMGIRPGVGRAYVRDGCRRPRGRRGIVLTCLRKSYLFRSLTTLTRAAPWR